MKKILLLCLYMASLFATEPLISAQKLQHILKKQQNLVIVDVSDKDVYMQGHIPTSLNSPISHWRDKHGKYLLIKETNAINKEFKKLGITKDSYVVVYSHHSNTKDILKASYVLWAMEYYGVKNSSILNGGIIAWRNQKGEIDYAHNSAKQAGNFEAKKNQSIYADLNFVKNSIGKANIIDARPTIFYFGAQKQIALAKAGHIPKAKSYFWRYSFKGDYFKDAALLKKMLVKGMNLHPDKATITYCTGGLETSMNFFVLHRLLGFTNIRLYDASMREWANDVTTPMSLYKWE